MSDMSVERPKSSTRRKLIIGLAATGGLAAAGGAVALLSGQRTPEMAAVSPTPKVDTSQPPKTDQPKTPEPTPNPIDLAIKEGKLELKGNWEEYFTPVTKAEAAQLLEKARSEAKSNEDSPLLISFDVRKAPNLVLQDIGFTLGGKRFNFIGVKNIPPGTVFSAADEGMADMRRSRTNLIFGVTKPGNLTSVIMNGENAQTFVPINGQTSVKIGTPLATIGSSVPAEYSLRNSLGEYQALLSFGRNTEQVDSGSLKNLLKKNGKFVFIQST